MTKANDLASLLDANGDVVSSALDNVPAAPTPSLSSLGIPNHDDVTVDASGNVGIGGSPTSKLSVVSGTNAGITVNDGTVNTILFNTSSANGSVGTTTNHPMAFYSNNAERMRIDSSGQLIVGHTGAGSPYFNEGIVLNPAGDSVFHRDGNSVVDFSRETSDGNIVRFVKDNSVVGSIGVDGGDNLYLTGQSGNTGGIYMNDSAVSPAYQGVERDNYYNLGKAPARWKDLYLSGGVYLGGTAAANHLDDYEEGLWNPTFVSSGGGESVSYDVQKGGYIKIGRFVHFQLQLGTTSVSGGSGYIQIGNLPFANDGATNGANAVSIGLAYGFATTITGGSSVQIGTTELIFYKNDNAANVWSWSSLATGASSNRCWISGTYITS